LSADDRQTRIDAIAAKALLLEPGDSFAVPVAGGESAAELALADIEDAVQRQHAAGAELLELFGPDELRMSIVSTSAATRIIIERAAAGGGD
jgi:hypothetical protein